MWQKLLCQSRQFTSFITLSSTTLAAERKPLVSSTTGSHRMLRRGKICWSLLYQPFLAETLEVMVEEADTVQNSLPSQGSVALCMLKISRNITMKKLSHFV
jgi:hypothetical protein